jgi:hypothetical protein
MQHAVARIPLAYENRNSRHNASRIFSATVVTRIGADCDIPLRKAIAKPRRMQVVEISGGNGAGVMRAGPVLTACGLWRDFGH